MNKPNGQPVNILVIVVSVCGMIFASGCKESSSDAAGKESGTAVNKSGRLVRASQKESVLTPDEIRRANQTSRGQLTNEVLSRLGKEADYTSFEKALNEVIQQQEQHQTGQDGLAEITQRLLSLHDQVLAHRQDAQVRAEAKSQEQLTQAIDTLQQAVAKAKNSDNREAQVSPECMLGTIYLLQARERKGQLQQQANTIQKLHAELSQSALEISSQETIKEVYASYFPDSEVKVLEDRLTGGDGTDAFAASTSLVNLLAMVEKSIVERTTQQDEVQKRIDTNLQQTRELHKEYLSLLEQADQAKGPAKYELQQQAYSVRSGFDEFGQKIAEGEIYYEAQAEIARNELEIVKYYLQWLQVRREQLKESITRIQTDIQTLSDKEMIQQTQAGIDQSAQQRSQLVSRLSESLTRLEEQEKTYGNLLQETVDLYRKASQAFKNASQAASRKTKEYANMFQKVSDTDLLNIWNTNRQHNENSAELVKLLEGIEEVQTVISRLSQLFKDQAAQAQTSAQEIETSLTGQGTN